MQKAIAQLFMCILMDAFKKSNYLMHFIFCLVHAKIMNPKELLCSLVVYYYTSLPPKNPSIAHSFPKVVIPPCSFLYPFVAACLSCVALHLHLHT